MARPMSLRVDDELDAKLRAEAKRRDVTVADLARTLIRRGLGLQPATSSAAAMKRTSCGHLKVKILGHGTYCADCSRKIR